MRLQELTIYSQYFRFLLEDDKAIADNTSLFGPMVTAVIYDNERQTVRCSCVPDGTPCEHKVFIHEMMDREKDSVLASFLNDCREDSAQTITTETINRLRGAFAREYNIAKGVVQTPERRPPLGWQGDVPGSSIPMRVVQRTPATFMVYELGEDKFSIVEGISIQQCKNSFCQGRETFCKHEQALREAVRTWREQGLLPPSRLSGKTANTVIMDDLTMVERAEPVSRTGKITGGLLTIPPGYQVTWDMGEILSNRAFRLTYDEGWEGSRNTTASADFTFDSSKFEEDMKKAKKLLDKKEKPKPEKPAKPRTRFTDLEL